MGLDPAVFAAIGMVSLLAGAANTPISASIMAVEIVRSGSCALCCHRMHHQFPDDRPQARLSKPGAIDVKVEFYRSTKRAGDV
jgi:hypothetical protein